MERVRTGTLDLRDVGQAQCGTTGNVNCNTGHQQRLYRARGVASNGARGDGCGQLPTARLPCPSGIGAGAALAVAVRAQRQARVGAHVHAGVVVAPAGRAVHAAKVQADCGCGGGGRQQEEKDGTDHDSIRICTPTREYPTVPPPVTRPRNSTVSPAVTANTT